MKYIISESQYKTLTEDLSISVRRRLPSNEEIKETLIGYVIGELGDDMVRFYTEGEFVAESCDMLVHFYYDDFIDDLDFTMSAKDRDALYYYFVDKFEKYLSKYYNLKRKQHEIYNN